MFEINLFDSISNLKSSQIQSFVYIFQSSTHVGILKPLDKLKHHYGWLQVPKNIAHINDEGGDIDYTGIGTALW